MTAWVEDANDVTMQIAGRWALRLGECLHESTGSMVRAAIDSGDRDLVLKVAKPHFESRDEATGLAEWDGNATARLVEATKFPTADVLLVERCRPGTALSTLDEPEQDHVIGTMLRRLWRPPRVASAYRSLAEMCAMWADSIRHKLPALPKEIDRGLTRAGIELYLTLPHMATHQVLLHTDLHAGNVLASAREPWLAIDPKPYVGDPAYDAVQHLLNCDRLLHDPEELVRRNADIVGVDRDRLRQWTFARCSHESLTRPPKPEHRTGRPG